MRRTALGLVLSAALITSILMFGALNNSPAEGESVGPQHFQAAFSALVPCCGQPNGQVFIDESKSVFTWQRQTLPYTVPVGKELRITDVHFGSKYIGSSGSFRSSYLVIDNVMTVPEHAATVHQTTPFIVPAGHTLKVSFINNSREAQWMNGYIIGWLVDVGAPF